MKKSTLSILIINCLYFLCAQAAPSTERIAQLENDQVTVWKTIIYPNNKQVLPMHRHEHNRVVIALTDGVLKVTNNKGRSHLLKLKKDTAYYLTSDVPNELHSDENISGRVIKVMVVELK